MFKHKAGTFEPALCLFGGADGTAFFCKYLIVNYKAFKRRKFYLKTYKIQINKQIKALKISEFYYCYKIV